MLETNNKQVAPQRQHEKLINLMLKSRVMQKNESKENILQLLVQRVE